MGALLDALKGMPPRLFENLVYDILVRAGLQNLVWRTPGADQGRDIEAEYRRTDWTGHVATERWYIECKRYEASVDWPTIYSKFAYADNHEVDFLMVMTTGVLTPQCKTEIARRSKHRVPQLRVWEGHTLENYLRLLPDIQAKYFLTPPTSPSPSHLSALHLLQKLSAAAYAAQELGEREAMAVEACASLSELLAIRAMTTGDAAGARQYGRWKEDDVYEWLDCQSGPPSGMDSHGLRALLALLRYQTRVPRMTMRLHSHDADTVTVEVDRPGAVRLELLQTTCFWSNLEPRLEGNVLCISRRLESGDQT